MTLKLVIIDDEALIANGLAWHLPWHEIDVEVAAVATNGRSGWVAIEEHAPDIVISDIVMPELNGLELAEDLNRYYPGTRLILISAHREFEYAQRAIEQQVEEYILKPIEPDKLMDAVQRAGEGIIEERNRSDRFTELEQVVKHVEPIASASLLFQIARFGSSRLDGLNPAVRRQLPDPLGVLVWVRLDPLPDKQEGDLFVRAGRIFAEKMTQAGLMMIQGDTEDKMALLILYDNASPDGDLTDKARELEIQAIIDQTCKYVGHELKRICSAVISRPFSNYADLHTIYRDTEHLAEPSALTEGGGAVSAHAQATYLGQDFESRMMVAIDQNYHRSEFSLKECGEMLHVSSFHLSRLYKQKTGKSFLEHLTERRIKEAARLLVDSDQSVAEVAAQSGFADPKYFSQVFRKHRDSTPSEFRTRHRGR